MNGAVAPTGELLFKLGGGWERDNRTRPEVAVRSREASSGAALKATPPVVKRRGAERPAT
jgi:hypothetical protein